MSYLEFTVLIYLIISYKISAITGDDHDEKNAITLCVGGNDKRLYGFTV